MKPERPSEKDTARAIQTLAKVFYANVIECLEKNPGWDSEDERLEEHRESILEFLKFLSESRFVSAHFVKAKGGCEKCGSAHAYLPVGVTSVQESITLVHHLLGTSVEVLDNISDDMVEDILATEKAEAASQENVTPLKKGEGDESTPEEEALERAADLVDHMPLRIAARLLDEADDVLYLHEVMTQGPDSKDTEPQEMDTTHFVH